MINWIKSLFSGSEETIVEGDVKTGEIYALGEDGQTYLYESFQTPQGVVYTNQTITGVE